MTRLLLAPTDALDPDLLTDVRAMIRTVFDDAFADGVFTQTDWQHCLGGTHAVVLAGDEPVAHAAVVRRELLVGDRPVSVGYVEGVAVAADHRGRGLGHRVMAAVESVLDAGGADGLPGALSSTDAGVSLYVSRGWRLWRGRLFVRRDDGSVRRTPEDEGSVYVREAADERSSGHTLDLVRDLTCHHREGEIW